MSVSPGRTVVIFWLQYNLLKGFIETFYCSFQNLTAERLSLASMAPSKKGVKLERNMTVMGGISLVVGTMIGSGIFVSPTGIIGMSGSIGSALIIWVLCGFIATVASLCYIELGIDNYSLLCIELESKCQAPNLARSTCSRVWCRVQLL